MFIGVYHISNLVTYLGIISALFGMGFSISGRFDFALIALIICGICDLFDGLFARSFSRTEEEKQFGVQLDSLADVLSFGALPVVLLYTSGLQQWYHFIALGVYLLALITRLAYFNISVSGTDTSQPIKFYRGMPVTYAALFFALAGLLKFLIAEQIFVVVYTLTALVVAFLFILNIKVPKPRGISYAVFGILAIGAVIAILVLR